MATEPVPAEHAPAISLVVSTRGSTSNFAQLFDSLDAQTFRDFDVIVVDQNDDDRVRRQIAAPRTFPVTYLATPDMRGASIGRNVGWRASRAEVILFPDDNCWYPANFLEHGLAVMAALPSDILTGRPADESGATILGSFEAVAGRITRASIWTTGIEWVMFVRRATLAALDGYDGDIGVGAATPWQACELQDLVLRAIDAGYTCYYDPTVFGHDRPWEELTSGAQLRRKARAYGRGMGYVLALHRFGLRQQARWVGRSALGALVYAARFDREKVAYYWETMLGRIEGIRGYARSKPR